MTDVTRILNAIEGGDAGAAEQLLPLVYEELRLLAARKLSHERPGQTLQATALVHEAYIRLVGSEGKRWESRRHFFAAAAEAMRRILVDNARRKRSIRHGGARRKVEFSDAFAVVEEPREDLLGLDEALEKLGEEDANLAELVKLRYFAGLTLEQVAQIMGIGQRTADRYWALGRAWLHQEMARDKST